jgi:hypothetical protein
MNMDRFEKFLKAIPQAIQYAKQAPPDTREDRGDSGKDSSRRSGR